MSLGNWTIYDTITGKIEVNISCNESDLHLNIGPNQSSIAGTYKYSTQYIPAGVVTERPVFPISFNKTTVVADGVDKVTITNIPEGTVFKCSQLPIDYREITVNDGSLELTFEVAGTYHFNITCFPYLDQEVEINAT